MSGCVGIHLLKARGVDAVIAAHRVVDRPDRFEPRRKELLKDDCGWFSKPRAEPNRQTAKGVTKK